MSTFVSISTLNGADFPHFKESSGREIYGVPPNARFSVHLGIKFVSNLDSDLELAELNKMSVLAETSLPPEKEHNEAKGRDEHKSRVVCAKVYFDGEYGRKVVFCPGHEAIVVSFRFIDGKKYELEFTAPEVTDDEDVRVLENNVAKNQMSPMGCIEVKYYMATRIRYYCEAKRLSDVMGDTSESTPAPLNPPGKTVLNTKKFWHRPSVVIGGNRIFDTSDDAPAGTWTTTYTIDIGPPLFVKKVWFHDDTVFRILKDRRDNELSHFAGRQEGAIAAFEKDDIDGAIEIITHEHQMPRREVEVIDLTELSESEEGEVGLSSALAAHAEAAVARAELERLNEEIKEKKEQLRQIEESTSSSLPQSREEAEEEGLDRGDDKKVRRANGYEEEDEQEVDAEGDVAECVEGTFSSPRKKARVESQEHTRATE
jgi:hypothetical protein